MFFDHCTFVIVKDDLILKPRQNSLCSKPGWQQQPEQEYADLINQLVYEGLITPQQPNAL